MNQKWEIVDQALGNLAKQTSTSTQDLGGLVKKLVEVAAPLEGKIEGAGKAAFDGLKANVDQIAYDLNMGMGSIAQGQQGMDAALNAGQTAMADEANRAKKNSGFDAAKFKG